MSNVTLKALQHLLQKGTGNLPIRRNSLPNVNQIYHCSSQERYAHPPYQIIIALSTMPLLLSLLQLNYADGDHNPFALHPTAMWTSVVALLVSMLASCCAFSAERNPIIPFIRVSITFGFLSVSSLTIAFLPTMYWWIICALWACSAAFLFTGLFQSVYLWFCRNSSPTIRQLPPPSPRLPV